MGMRPFTSGETKAILFSSLATLFLYMFVMTGGVAFALAFILLLVLSPALYSDKD